MPLFENSNLGRMPHDHPKNTSQLIENLDFVICYFHAERTAYIPPSPLPPDEQPKNSEEAIEMRPGEPYRRNNAPKDEKVTEGLPKHHPEGPRTNEYGPAKPDARRKEKSLKDFFPPQFAESFGFEGAAKTRMVSHLEHYQEPKSETSIHANNYYKTYHIIHEIDGVPEGERSRLWTFITAITEPEDLCKFELNESKLRTWWSGIQNAEHEELPDHIRGCSVRGFRFC